MARVIRAQRSAGSGVLPAQLYDARTQAEAIVHRARHEAELLREAARAAGFAAGKAEAAASLVHAEAARSRALAQLEADATRASLAVAGHLLRAQLELEPERIVPMVAPLLSRVRRASNIVLQVHPLDAAALHDALPALHERLELAGRLALEEDPHLQRGDCVVISNLGELDARIDTQLRALLQALGVEEA